MGFSPSRVPFTSLCLPCRRWARALAEAGSESRILRRSSPSRFRRSRGWGFGERGQPGRESGKGGGPRLFCYLRRQRSDSALGALARSSDKSPRPAREGAAEPGTARPGPRAPPGTEAPRSPTPRSCPGYPSPPSSRPKPRRGRTGAGQGVPKKTLPAAAPSGSVRLLITSPQGLRPSRGIPQQLASLAPHGRPLYTQRPV